MKTISLALGALALSAAGFVAGDTTKTYKTCTTKIGLQSKANVPSTTYGLTITKTARQVVTKTPSTTITPALTTITSTSTEIDTTTTTLSQITDTFTETTIQYQTKTDTVTADTTTFTLLSSTTTTLQSTSTIPAGAGFTPLGSAFPGAAKKRSLQGRLEARAAASPTKIQCKLVNGKPSFSPAVYPTSVICAQLVEVIKTSTSTKTATQTTTITAPTPSTTKTVTVTSIITETQLQMDASTTTTQTDVMTNTVFLTTIPSTTITTTTTTTLILPSATTYAQCQPNNIARNYNNVGIEGVQFGIDYADTQSVSASSAYDCCVACATSPGCTGFVAVFGCYIMIAKNNVCLPDRPVTNQLFYTDRGLQPDPNGFAVGNGQCGQYSYGGSN